MDTKSILSEEHITNMYRQEACNHNLEEKILNILTKETRGLIDLSNLKAELHDYDEAIKYLKMVTEKFDKLKLDYRAVSASSLIDVSLLYFLEPDCYADIRLNIHILYYNLGFYYVEVNKCKEAIKAFKKALKWNPMFNAARYELIEVYKKLNDTDSLYKMNEEYYNHAYSVEELVNYYCNLAYYYSSIHNFDLAIYILLYARTFHENTSWIDEEISYVNPRLTKAVNFDDFVDILDNNHIKLFLRDDIVNFIYATYSDLNKKETKKLFKSDSEFKEYLKFLKELCKEYKKYL